jgi:tetratricopeptide (TPR) repeat protein
MLTVPPAWAQGNQDSISQDTLEALTTDYVGRGNAYLENGRYDQAIGDYTKAIERLPVNADVYNRRAWAYHLKGENVKALPDANKAVALAPADANCRETRAEIYEKLGRGDKAIADYRAALRLDPNDRESLAGLKRLGVTP